MSQEELVALRQEVARFHIKEAVVDRLNEYGYTLDANDWEGYEANFTDDCKVVMSFSSHEGRAGLGAWMREALKGVERGVHLSSNFDVKLVGEPETCCEVKARSKLHAACHFGGELHNALTLGGIYAWTLARKSPADPWLVSACKFEPYWSRGNDTLLQSDK